jgi:hypothetical protein
VDGLKAIQLQLCSLCGHRNPRGLTSARHAVRGLGQQHSVAATLAPTVRAMVRWLTDINGLRPHWAGGSGQDASRGSGLIPFSIPIRCRSAF